MGLGHNGTGTQWDLGSLVLIQSGTVVQWAGTQFLGHGGTRAQKDWGTMDLGHSGLVGWGKNGLETVTSHRRTGANVKGDILFQAMRKQITDQQMMIQINEI